METEVIAELRDVTTRLGSRLVHDRISLTVRVGEVLAVVGGSGSGKTTLLREMLMLQQPSAGSVWLWGQDVTGIDEDHALPLRRRIGVVFQEDALFSGMTVLENVSTPLREHTRLGRRLVDEIAAVKVALTGLGADSLPLAVSQLSGGMRRRTALARALALDPELLFLDEPTAGLDPVSADGLDALINQLRSSLNLSIVMVTHDIDSLWHVATRVVLIAHGQVLAGGTLSELYDSQQPEVVEFLQGPRGRSAWKRAWPRS